MPFAAVTRLLLLSGLVLASCAGPDTENAQVTAPAPASTTRKEVPPAHRNATVETAASRQKGRVTRIPLGDLFQLQQENRVLIFDVRPALIYRLGHIPGAVSWPKGDFNARVTTHEPSITAARAEGKPVVVYCADLACPDARTVATWLSERGHSVSVLEGGWDAWQTGQLPVE